MLGVQTEGFNVANSQAYASKAKSLNADGIISLVPPNASDADADRLFQGAGGCQRPADHGPGGGRCQCRQLVALAAAVPSIVAVKDEAGDPLERAPDLLKKTGGKLEDFSGGGGMTFFAELELGFLGTCPYTGLADVLQACFNAYRAGKKREAYDIFGRFLAFNSLPHANEYVMKARGVFAGRCDHARNPGARRRRRRAPPRGRDHRGAQGRDTPGAGHLSQAVPGRLNQDKNF